MVPYHHAAVFFWRPACFGLSNVGRERLRDVVEARLDFVRKLVMEGWLDEDIVRRCHKSTLFIKTRYASSHVKHRIGKRTIRQCYLYRAKKEFREHYFDTAEEIAKACNDFARALSYAHEKKSAEGVARVWREKGRMLGLRRAPDVEHDFDGAALREQVEAMDLSIGPPGKDGD